MQSEVTQGPDMLCIKNRPYSITYAEHCPRVRLGERKGYKDAQNTPKGTQIEATERGSAN
jgi:hypothetical protein